MSKPKGWGNSPILKLRNKPCICGSEIKTKRCCGIYPYWKQSLVDMYHQMEKGEIHPDIFFAQFNYEKENPTKVMEEVTDE